MLKRNSEVIVNNEKYENIKGIISSPTLQVVYEVVLENGKRCIVPEKDLTVIRKGED